MTSKALAALGAPRLAARARAARVLVPDDSLRSSSDVRLTMFGSPSSGHRRAPLALSVRQGPPAEKPVAWWTERARPAWRRSRHVIGGRLRRPPWWRPLCGPYPSAARISHMARKAPAAPLVIPEELRSSVDRGSPIRSLPKIGDFRRQRGPPPGRGLSRCSRIPFTGIRLNHLHHTQTRSNGRPTASSSGIARLRFSDTRATAAPRAIGPDERAGRRLQRRRAACRNGVPADTDPWRVLAGRRPRGLVSVVGRGFEGVALGVDDGQLLVEDDLEALAVEFDVDAEPPGVVVQYGGVVVGDTPR